MFEHHIYLLWYYIGDNGDLLDVFEHESSAIKAMKKDPVFQQFDKFEKYDNRPVWTYGDRQFIIEQWKVK